MSAVEGWVETPLGDVAALIKGISYASEDYCGPDEGAVFITIKCVSKAGGFKAEGIKYYKGKLEDSQKLQPKDLLIANTDLTRAGDIVGAPMVVPSFDGDTVTMSMDLSKVKENDTIIDREFLYYKLMTDPVRRFMKDHASGSTVLHLQTRAVPNLKLDYPSSKPEQTKIAEILSTVDRAIEQTEALIAKQQRIKTGLMQDLLTRGIDEQGNLRSEETHEFKDSVLGRIPVEWVVKRLGNLLSSINQGWSPDCEPDPAGMGEWGVLKTTAVVWQGFQENENKLLPTRLKPKSSLEIKAGDLLMTRAGPNSRVGVVAYVYNTRRNLMLSDKIYRLVPDKEVDGRFLCYSLSGFESQRHLSNLKTGMAESQTNISQEIVKALMTVCPPEKEQVVIADRLDFISNESNQTLKVLNKLYSLKTALMQDLLTGKKRVTALLASADVTEYGKGVD